MFKQGQKVENCGRKREFNYELIAKLKADGMSSTQIMARFGCSLSVVQRAVRLLKRANK